MLLLKTSIRLSSNDKANPLRAAMVPISRPQNTGLRYGLRRGAQQIVADSESEGKARWSSFPIRHSYRSPAMKLIQLYSKKMEKSTPPEQVIKSTRPRQSNILPFRKSPKGPPNLQVLEMIESIDFPKDSALAAESQKFCELLQKFREPMKALGGKDMVAFIDSEYNTIPIPSSFNNPEDFFASMYIQYDPTIAAQYKRLGETDYERMKELVDGLGTYYGRLPMAVETFYGHNLDLFLRIEAHFSQYDTENGTAIKKDSKFWCIIDDAYWAQNLNDLKAFHLEGGQRMPRIEEIYAGVMLGKWCYELCWRANVGLLTEKQFHVLNRFSWWDWEAYTTEMMEEASTEKVDAGAFLGSTTANAPNDGRQSYLYGAKSYFYFNTFVKRLVREGFFRDGECSMDITSTHELFEAVVQTSSIQGIARATSQSYTVRDPVQRKLLIVLKEKLYVVHMCRFTDKENTYMYLRLKPAFAHPWPSKKTLRKRSPTNFILADNVVERLVYATISQGD